ncbi:hypothetical protein [Wolbachia endosymbiont of Oedothorax gibbosus]|uniref:hypothetical protein n=1 Tax=Wolbachia endosymbiont of Oedothorax gibbosus TaxID=931100 RepID=UPI0020252C73|nr:hypothetical protein [Wolbachia endosymbiont of Oedothorax gibbosus]
MSKKKVTVVRKDQKGKNRKFNIDLSVLPEDVLSALEGISCNNIQQLKSKEPMPSPRDNREKPINFGKGLDYVYGTKPLSNQEDYPDGLNPFASGLQKIKPSSSENKELSWCKSAVVTAKNPKELYEVVGKVINAGARLNACNEGEWSVAEYVILGTYFHKCKKGDLKKVMCELMLKGAEFHDNLLQNKLIGETYNELQKEVQPQLEKQREELKKVGENALHKGTVIDVERDNETYFMELSADSEVEVAKVVEGARNLGLNKGYVKSGSHILKMGGSEIEVKNEKGGARNYVDVSDNSVFEVTFPTSIGGLRIVLCHKADQVQVRVADTEMWAELQRRGEVVGKGCLFGGMTVKEAVERGSFTRCGIWSEKQATKEIKEVSETLSSSSWVDRTRRGSEAISRK